MKILFAALSILVLTACASSPVPPSAAPRAPSSTAKGVFPLSFQPHEEFTGTSKNAFGAPRGNRSHAAVSLVTDPGAKVLSIYDNGKVIRGPYALYINTFAVDIEYADGSVIRYGGLENGGVKVGESVNQGSVIGTVAKRTTDGVSALQIELYSGRAKGPLTKVGENKFGRRGDLLDPTSILKDLERKAFQE